MGNLQLLVAKLSLRGKSTKRALSPGPGRKNVALPSFTSALPWSKLHHKLTQMKRKLGPGLLVFSMLQILTAIAIITTVLWHGNLRLVSRLIWETDNTIGCLWTNNDRSRTVCLSHVVDPGDKACKWQKQGITCWLEDEVTLTYHNGYHTTSMSFTWFTFQPIGFHWWSKSTLFNKKPVSSWTNRCAKFYFFQPSFWKWWSTNFTFLSAAFFRSLGRQAIQPSPVTVVTLWFLVLCQVAEDGPRSRRQSLHPQHWHGHIPNWWPVLETWAQTPNLEGPHFLTGIAMNILNNRKTFKWFQIHTIHNS